ncbi:hypothetical protein CEXT_300471 [Caerostris extrusa]|uniref:Uncharacterized protein n=1 Tax=Caerostris extrusa TaxID=172846 RepID=A0AAV4X4J6_CAEEX|nr:hypothetical protein CEXT_300471 [Caerostris extrusa]
MADGTCLVILSSPDDRDGVGVASADGDPTLDDAESSLDVFSYSFRSTQNEFSPFVERFNICGSHVPLMYYCAQKDNPLLNCVLYLRSQCFFLLPFIAAVIRLCLEKMVGRVGSKRAQQNSLRTLVARRWSAPWNDGCVSRAVCLLSLARLAAS